MASGRRGISLKTQEKLEIALQLARLGVRCGGFRVLVRLRSESGMRSLDGLDLPRSVRARVLVDGIADQSVLIAVSRPDVARDQAEPIHLHWRQHEHLPMRTAFPPKRGKRTRYLDARSVSDSALHCVACRPVSSQRDWIQMSWIAWSAAGRVRG
jgi:hypothetical protein